MFHPGDTNEPAFRAALRPRDCPRLLNSHRSDGGSPLTPGGSCSCSSPPSSGSSLPGSSTSRRSRDLPLGPMSSSRSFSPSLSSATWTPRSYSGAFSSQAASRPPPTPFPHQWRAVPAIFPAATFPLVNPPRFFRFFSFVSRSKP